MPSVETIQVPIPGGHLPVTTQLLQVMRPGLYRVSALLPGQNGGRVKFRPAGKVRVRGGKIILSGTNQRAIVFSRPELVVRALEANPQDSPLRFSAYGPTKRQAMRAGTRERTVRRGEADKRRREAEARHGEPSAAARIAATTQVDQPKRTRAREAWRTRKPGALGALLGLVAAASALAGPDYGPTRKRRGR